MIHTKFATRISRSRSVGRLSWSVADRWRRSPVVLLLGVVLAIGACQKSGPEPPERIILIVIDTLRPDFLTPYGSEVLTPTIGRLAAEGQVFRNAVASYHQTTMSMAALFTGRTPSLESGSRARSLPWNGNSFCGMARFAKPPHDTACVPSALETLAEKLQAAGYWTIGVVSNRLLFAPYGFEQGFDQWVEVSGSQPVETEAAKRTGAGIRPADFVNRAALKALTRRERDKFFLYLHYVDVHDWQQGAKGQRRDYGRSVEALDRSLGKLLAELERQGLLEDATIIFTSDHGEALGEKHALPGRPAHMGNPSFESVLRVPLIISPAHFDDSDRLVRSEDLLSLVMEMIGVPHEATSELRDQELLVTEAHYQTYRYGHWKSVWPRGSETLHLFDLVSDPQELQDVAAEHPKVVQEHRDRITELSETLATHRLLAPELSEDDRRRLRALGYLD